MPASATSVTLAAVSAPTFTSLSPEEKKLVKLLEDVDLTLANHLYSSQSLDDVHATNLWRGIQGWRGMRRMWHEAGSINRIFVILAKVCPCGCGVVTARNIWWDVLQLRLYFVAVVIERAVGKLLPVGSMHLHVFALSYFALYWALDVITEQRQDELEAAFPNLSWDGFRRRFS